MLEIGSPIYVRYRDHVLFKDMDPEAFSAPFIRETIGWLEGENDNSIQVVWERSAGANTPEKAKQKATGLVIMKSSILEMLKLNGRYLYRANVGINDAHAQENDDGPHIQAHSRALEGTRQERGHLRSNNQPDVGRGERA